jgi:urea transport system substrate-binding protein
MNAPEGVVRIDPTTQHTSKTIRIGKIVDSGRFQILYTSEEAIVPIPYPPTVV